MKNKIHSLIVEGIVFCGSGLVLLSYSLSSYAKGFNKSWAQSPYLFPLMDRRRGSYGDEKGCRKSG